MIKLCFSLLLLGIGALTAWRCLGPLFIRQVARPAAESGDRPWRKLGAGIMLVICVMFVAGIYVVDIPDRPGIYATYWLVLVGLLFWLCGLAIKDARYTRKILVRSRTDARRREWLLLESKSLREDPK